MGAVIAPSRHKLEEAAEEQETVPADYLAAALQMVREGEARQEALVDAVARLAMKVAEAEESERWLTGRLVSITAMLTAVPDFIRAAREAAAQGDVEEADRVFREAQERLLAVVQEHDPSQGEGEPE